MPLDPSKIDAVRLQLTVIAAGGKPKPIDIGSLTADQFAAINKHRTEHGLPSLESAVIVYVGRHHYVSRSKDGYTIEDMVKQLQSALCADSKVIASRYMTAMENPNGRADGYGKVVHDRVILELTTRKPKAEAFSVVPKGD